MTDAIGRRAVLTEGAALAALTSGGLLTGTAAALAAEQGPPVSVGAVVPLTGGGAPYGPNMLKSLELTVADVNAAGGPLGRKLVLHASDGETKPDAAVTATEKLISINHVVAILGTWSSAVTLAVIPATFQAGIVEMNGSGAPSITGPEYRELVFRTYPIDTMHGVAMARFAKQKGYHKIFLMVLNNPYALATRSSFEAEWKKLGMSPPPKSLVYNPGATSYSAEVEQALRGKPDLLIVLGYTPDSSIIAKEWFAENVPTHVMGPGFAFTDAFVKNVGARVVEGFFAVDGIPAIGEPAFEAFAKKFTKATGASLAENYWSAQVHDQVNLLALAIEAGKSTVGKTVAQQIMLVANPPGEEVHDFASGAAALRKGQKINYEGASGPCDFTATHDVLANFAVWEFHNGKRKQVAFFPAKEFRNIL